jgi:acyl-CoA reductase-like NAD-dependent aldehyde dehydrogenase
MNAQSSRTNNVAELAHPDKLFIGGRWVAPQSNRKLRLINPATEQQFFEVPEASEGDLQAAVTAARRAFDKGPWPRTPPAERARKMRDLADALVRRSRSLERAWISQIGTPVSMATGSVEGVATVLRYYADLADTYKFEDVRKSGGYASQVAVVAHEPVGVVAAIAPWNGPLMTMMMKLAPALAAGCVVITKPSPETPLEAFLLAEAAEEVGLPDGVINLLPAGREVSDLLIRNPGIDKVAFTGSTAVGLHIASVCASRMARYTMELGGKSAAIVLEDFEPARVGPMLAPQITMGCGQVCINYSRVLVPRKRYNDYVESLAESMRKTAVGDPLDPATWMGPLAMRTQLDRVMGYIEKGRAEGAQIAAGGGRPKGLNVGCYIEPTVFAQATNDMVISREEIFGPVTAVIPYDTEEDAIEIANDSDYGLSGGVYTDDTDRAYQIGRRIRTGNFTQNGREFDLTNPFGGFKKSGYGREGGVEAIEPYLELKSIFLPKRPTKV